MLVNLQLIDYQFKWFLISLLPRIRFWQTGA